MRKHQSDSSLSLSNQSQFTPQCNYCQIANVPFWIKMHLTLMQRNPEIRQIRIIKSILQRKRCSQWINCKQAIMFSSNTKQLPIEYKVWDQIIKEIKESVLLNIQVHPHYDKLYFGRNNYQTMLKYQTNKKAFLLKLNSKKTSTSTNKLKFKVNKSALSTQSQDNKVLLDSQLLKKYDFCSISTMEKLKMKGNSQSFSSQGSKAQWSMKSKQECSQIQIQRLKRCISIMVKEQKDYEDQYPQIKDMRKPYIEWTKSMRELKMRKKLQANISQIREISKTAQNKNENNMRMYTSPDMMNDSNDRYYAEAYGLLIEDKASRKNLMRSRENPENRMKKKSLVMKKSRDKINTTNNTQNMTQLTSYSKTKLNANSKNKYYGSRQTTQQGSHLTITTNSTNRQMTNLNQRSKSKSKSRLKNTNVQSKNKLMLARSNSRNKLTRLGPAKDDKSLNKSKKQLERFNF